MSQQRPPNDDREDPFTALRRAADQSFAALFSSIISLPSAIYRQGNDHGREWARLSRKGREGPESDDNDTAGHSHEGCPYLKNGGSRCERSTVQAQKGDGNGDDGPEDWMARIISEMEKGEQRAMEMYESWKRYLQEDFSPNRSVEAPKEAQVPEGTVKGRHCKRDGAWWGRRCGPQEKADSNEKTSESTSENEHQETVSADQDWRQQWPTRFPAPSELPNELDDLAAELDRFFDQCPSTSRELDPSLPWLLKSPYSPFRLETESGFDRSWRNRLEDLLRAQAGIDMNNAEDNERNGQSNDSDYAKRMVELLRMIEHRRQTSSDESEDRFENLGTEEDLYSRFLGDFSASPCPPRHQPAPGQQVSTSKPSVLSTLTTSERHVAPDGTVTTKTVLKRRFADGREESEERLETSKDPTWNNCRKPEDKNVNEDVPKSTVIQELAKKDQNQQKRGWFWSS